MALYQCIKFHLFTFTFSDMPRTSLLLQKIRKGNNSVITCAGLLFVHSALFLMGLYQMYQVFLNSLLYFQRYAPDRLFLANIKKKCNSVNTGDRFAVLAFGSFSDGLLSIYQVSFNYHLYVQRFALDKLFIPKSRKGSNSVKTITWLWCLHYAILLMTLYQVYQISFSSLVHFQRYSPDQIFSANIKKGVRVGKKSLRN